MPASPTQTRQHQAHDAPTPHSHPHGQPVDGQPHRLPPLFRRDALQARATDAVPPPVPTRPQRCSPSQPPTYLTRVFRQAIFHPLHGHTALATFAHWSSLAGHGCQNRGKDAKRGQQGIQAHTSCQLLLDVLNSRFRVQCSSGLPSSCWPFLHEPAFQAMTCSWDSFSPLTPSWHRSSLGSEVLLPDGCSLPCSSGDSHFFCPTSSFT